MPKISAKDVLQMKWAIEQGLVKPELAQPIEEQETADQSSEQDRIMPGHVPNGISTMPKDTIENENNPVVLYVNEMIVDLVSKRHIQFMNMSAVRSVFRGVLLRLCDAEPHTFSDIRSSITPTRRHFVKQILVCLQKANLVVEVELNNRLFYRADLDEVHKIRAYIVATESVR